MRSSRERIIRTALTIISIFLVVFIISRLYPLLRGPYIQDINISQYQEIEEHYVYIEARFNNTERVSINGVQGTITQDGRLRELIALNLGYNVIEIEAEDSFDNVRRYKYSIYTPSSEELNLDVYTQEVLEEQETNQE